MRDGLGSTPAPGRRSTQVPTRRDAPLQAGNKQISFSQFAPSVNVFYLTAM
jgi:hypothetical protein